MFKIKSLLFFILLLVFCSTASARVCFLVGTNDPNSKYTNCIGGPLENYVPIVNCPDHSQCEIPAKGVKPCRESGSKLYKAEDCCSNSMLYEECSPAEGKVCQGTVCRGTDENGDDYVSCERGKCVCGAEYTQTCSEEGLVGVGRPCNGLYKECECDRTKFFKCDGIATELGTKCVDSTGEYYSGCVCPAPDGDDWVTDPDDCCSVSSVSCVNQPSGEEIFKCNPKPMYSCMCGYTYSKSGCQSGCIDDNYSYKGSRVNVTCTGGFSDSLLDAQDICGSGCTCAVGYWDYTETCNNSNADVCATLGYTETSCEDKYVACPFDASMKRCIQDVQSCEYSSAAECESDNFNSVCKSNELGCWSAVACKTGTQKSSDKCATEFGFVKPAKLVNADKQGCSVCEYAKDTCNEFNPNFYSETELKNKECKSNVLLDLNGSYKKCYYNCESKCTYADKNACESASENINSACQENENGCFVPSECKVGYFKEANEVNCKGATYTQLSGVDVNGCGYCASEYDTCEQAGYINADATDSEQTEFCVDAAIEPWGLYTSNGTYKPCLSCGVATCSENEKSNTRCEKAYVNSVCSSDNGCHKPQKCKDGYAKICSSGKAPLGIDAFGCGRCDIVCPYADEATCKTANFNSVCTPDVNGCYNPTACQETRYKEANDTNCRYAYSKLDGIDAFGCGWCATKYDGCSDLGYCDGQVEADCEGTLHLMYLSSGKVGFCYVPNDACTYITQENCETVNENAVCKKTIEGCYIFGTCKDGYKFDDGKCVIDYGCADDEYTNEEDCKKANEHFVCKGEPSPYAGGTCYSLNGCENGYKLENGKCVLDCEYANESACESANFNSDCTDVDGCYLPTGCTYGAAKEFNSSDLSSCMMGGRYYATKLVNIDPAGCGRCGTNYNSCDQLGYLVGSHSGDGYDSSTGREFLFLSSQGQPRDCWILNDTCPYDTLSDCQATGGSCIYNMGCYEAKSCASGYTLTDGKCVANTSATTCENISTGSEYVKYGTGMSCPSGFDIGGPEQIDGMVCTECCKYAGQMSCENANTGTVCERVANTGCFAPSTTCKDGYTLQNGKCVASGSSGGDGHSGGSDDSGSTVTCTYTSASACQGVYTKSTCTKDSDGCYNPSSCASGYAKSCASGYSLTSTDSYGCGTCKKNCTYTSASACQAVYTKSTCTQDSDGCYNPSACASGYTKSCSGGTLSGTDGYGCGTCTTDSCTVTTYSAFTTALANSSCTTVTLASDIIGTADTSTSYLTIPYGKTINGAGYELQMSRTLYPSDGVTIKNLDMTWANNKGIRISNEEDNVIFSNVNITTTATSGENYAISLDEMHGQKLIFTGTNSITVRGGTTNAAIENQLSTGFEVAEGSTLTIDVSGGTNGYGIFGGESDNQHYVNGTLTMNIEGTSAISDIAYFTVNGNLDITYTGTGKAIDTSIANIIIAEGGHMKVVSNSSDTTISLDGDWANMLELGGTLEIEAPIANGKYFIDTDENIVFTSANAKLITKSTGSRTLSDTDVGINTQVPDAVEGATWQVSGSGYSKDWKCNQTYDRTSDITYPQSPYWCDTSKECGKICPTGTFVDKTECIASLDNSVCWPDSNECYVPYCKSGYRLKDGVCVAFETCEEGGMLTSKINHTCPGSWLCNVEDVYSYDNEVKMGSCCACTGYSSLENCQASNPGAICGIGVLPAMQFVGGTLRYEPKECPQGQEIVDWKCVTVSCEYADQTACERENYRSVCEPDVNGCYVPTKCENNYYRTGDECAEDRGVWGGMIQDADPYGCGECIEIIL